MTLIVADVTLHRDHRTLVTPVLLGKPCHNFPAGTVIGRVQTRFHFGRPRFQPSATFTHDCTVMGHDYDWMVHEFKEEQCGERQARIGRLQPGRECTVTRTFGYLAHDPCIYERGDFLVVTRANAKKITTMVTRPGGSPQTADWDREGFEALVNTFAIIEQAL